MTDAELTGGTPYPWGPRLWSYLAVVTVVAAGLQLYGIDKWPMADDEVLSLETMGLLHIDPGFWAFPPDHLGKLPQVTPFWHTIQRAAIAVLPDNIVGYRIPSVICGVLTSALMFLLAARWRGLWFAVALSIVANGNQLFIHVAQVNRFYSMPLLLVTVAFAAMWVPRGGLGMVIATSLAALAAVLSHNVTVAAFGLAFVASVVTYMLGLAPMRTVLRSGAAFVVTGLVYVLYLMPLVRGWHTTGNPTPVLVSFAAYAGIPTIALALLGGWVILTRRDLREPALWCALVLAGTLCMFVASTFSWNPRYFVFFLPALWMVAAEAMHFVAQRVNRGTTGAIWYACVALLLLPNLFSHLADGSRHDYQSAAAVVSRQVQSDEQILSDDAETITYYLSDELRRRLRVRTKVVDPPASSFLLVTRANAWAPLPRYGDRRVEVLAEIYARRFDQFSHIVRVYRVH